MGKIELDHTGAGSGITLSSDGTDLLLNGTAVGGGGGGASALTIDNKTGAYTVVSDDLGKIINCTSGTFTVSLTAAATLGAGFNVTIWNTSDSAANAITIDPTGSETIDGLATLILRRGEGIQIVCDGTNFQTGDKKAMRGYAENFSAGDSRPSASGSSAIAMGLSATASGTQSFAAGGWATASGTASVSIGGYITATIASATYGTALGSHSAGRGSQAVTGSGAMALGGSYASGVDSFAAAIANNTSSYGATGANSVAMGSLAKASNGSTFAVGYTATASGSSAVAIGYTALASGLESVAIGDANATGNTSVAIGNGAQASGSASYAIGEGAQASGVRGFATGFRTSDNGITGKYAWSGASISGSNDGSSQEGRMVLIAATTDDTATALTTFTTPNATNQIILPNNSAYAFHGTIVARQQASQGTACAAWKVEGLIRREGSAGTTVLVNSATTILDNTPAWGMVLSADTTNGGLKIEVTGAAATNIRWVATIHTSEVTY